MVIIYNIFYFFALIIYIPVLMAKGKWHKGMLSRFCSLSDDIKDQLRNRKNIWVHAVSVGEVNAVKGLVELLEKAYPDFTIVISTVTPTGREMALQAFSNRHIVFYSPIDFSWIVNRMVRDINPVMYLSTETEWWPNLFRALNKALVPIIQINGRVSDESFVLYQKYKWFTTKTLRYVNLFCMQTMQDAQRVQELGVKQNKIKVVGNLKFDISHEKQEEESVDLGFADDVLVWVAGSTHPGEEEIIVKVYSEILAETKKEIRLVLAPRHVERAGSIKLNLSRQKISSVLFTELKSGRADNGEVIVIDKVGLLSGIYERADIVFIGKTLKVGGGQNMIEPASFAKPVIVGPLTQNFKDVMSMFLKNQAMIQLKNENQLKDEVLRFINDSEERFLLGALAKRVVVSNRGAARGTLNLLSEFIKKS